MVDLVIGATGFIGKNLVNALLRKGVVVRAFVRDSNKTEFDKSVDVVKGDLFDLDSIKNALKDVEHVYNVSGLLGGAGVTYEQLYSVNVKVVENLIDAVIGSGVKQIIHFSSVAAMGIQKPYADESAECRPVTDYDRSKFFGEEVLKKKLGDMDINYTILRPTMVYGPGEVRNKLKMFRLIQKGIFKIIGNGKNLMSLVYVDDVVDSAILVRDNKKAFNEIFIINDHEPYTMNQFVEEISYSEGVRVPRHIPKWIALLAAYFFEFLLKIKDFNASLTLDRVGNLVSSHSFSIKKAVSVLGYKPKVGMKEGVRRSVEWYKEKGLL